MSTGTIIFLNGTSSSGKTTLAHHLQEILQLPYLHLALDQFRDGLPPRYRGLNSPPGTDGDAGLNVVPVSNGDERYTRICFGSVGKTMLKGMRRAIAAMAHCGNNIIIDDVLLEREFLDDYLEVFQELKVYFVGVMCPRDVLTIRENTRPGRFPGTATGHYDVCHEHKTYDLEVDTSILTPHECASRVVALVNNQEPIAFPALVNSRILNTA